MSDTRGHRPSPFLVMLALCVAGFALAAAGCGSDDDTRTAGAPLSADEWRMQAEQFCSDAIEEATALPLPETNEQLGPDAASRAEIIGNVRDSMLGLGQPDGVDADDVSAYIDDLNTDISQLTQISQAAQSGGVTQDTPQVDESSGQLADGLGLTNCAALSQAIARTP